MSSQKRIIVGYDVRESLQNYQERWDKKRRSEYLYKQEALVPLTTDYNIWHQAYKPKPEELGFTNSRGIWTSLRMLESFCDQDMDLSVDDYLIIAIEIVMNEEEKDKIELWEAISWSVTPSSASDEWRFLGYDVSDKWLLSGLSNCGFLPTFENVDSIKQQWSPFMNTYHLFDDVTKADEFAEFSNSRVTEHSPFFVFGVWKV